MDNKQVEQLQQIAQQAFAQTPSVYANGYVNGLGATGDAYVVLQTNGENALVVNMTLSIAKTLGESLLTMVDGYEKTTGQRVPMIQELAAVS